MAACGVATETAKERHDVVFEMIAARLLRPLHIDLDLGRLARRFDDDLGIAVRDCVDDSL